MRARQGETAVKGSMFAVTLVLLLTTHSATAPFVSAYRHRIAALVLAYALGVATLRAAANTLELARRLSRSQAEGVRGDRNRLIQSRRAREVPRAE